MFKFIDWKINPQKTAVLIYTWPHGMEQHLLSEWLFHRFRRPHYFNTNKDDPEPPNLICRLTQSQSVHARNTAMEYATTMLPDFYEWILFSDNDILPSVDTDEMFRLDTDIKACRVARDGPHSWPRPNSFHDALWCIRIEDLRKIEPPWFSHGSSNENGTQQIGCDCSTFSERALAVGLTIGHAGHAGHREGSSISNG